MVGHDVHGVQEGGQRYQAGVGGGKALEDKVCCLDEEADQVHGHEELVDACVVVGLCLASILTLAFLAEVRISHLEVETADKKAQME